MKKFLLFLSLFLSITNAVNADVININGFTYATEDSIIVHCADGQNRELMSLPQSEISYILARNEISPITMNGKQYINLTTLSQSLMSEGKNEYVIPKNKKENLGKKAGKIAVREYVYNGSDYAMQNTPTGRYYIQNAIGKTENLIGVFQSSSLSSWDKIRNVIFAFGY